LLARLARHTAQERQVPVLISNHATALTYELYRGASLDEIQVKRTISRMPGIATRSASCWRSICPAWCLTEARVSSRLGVLFAVFIANFG
jgi:hypothetical protein